MEKILNVCQKVFDVKKTQLRDKFGNIKENKTLIDYSNEKLQVSIK